MDVRLVGAWDRQAARFCTHCQEQPVERNRAAVTERHLASAGVQTNNFCAETKLDVVFAIEAGFAQRHPIFWGFACQVILREIGPIDRCGAVVAEHHDAALKFLAAKLFCRGEAGGSTTHDHDFAGMSGPIRAERRWFRARPLCPGENRSFGFFDEPARNRAKGRCAHRFTCMEVETGMMPGAPDRAFADQSLRQRAMIMRTESAQNVRFPVRANQYRGFFSHAAFRYSRGKVCNPHAFGKVRTLRDVRLVSHCLFLCTCPDGLMWPGRKSSCACPGTFLENPHLNLRKVGRRFRRQDGRNCQCGIAGAGFAPEQQAGIPRRRRGSR